MNRRWIHTLSLMALFLLAGCGETLEEQVAIAVAEAEIAFEQATPEPNQTVEQLAIYVPEGYTVEKGDSSFNYMIRKEDEEYLLFMNPLEKDDSEWHYTRLQQEYETITYEEVFAYDGLFGFLAVIEASEEQAQLVVSIGGKKMTAITSTKDVDARLAAMLAMTRSAQLKK